MSTVATASTEPSVLEPVSRGDFSARVVYKENSILVELVGNGDVHAQDVLETFLAALHNEVTRRGFTSVEIDCHELVFMNSTCLKAIVSWIAVVQEADASSQYKICFLSNPRLHWQKRSMRAISCFAADLVTIQE
jgi:hypothetical protein